MRMDNEHVIASSNGRGRPCTNMDNSLCGPHFSAARCSSCVQLQGGSICLLQLVWHRRHHGLSKPELKMGSVSVGNSVLREKTADRMGCCVTCGCRYPRRCHRC
jgi:hypothetical protein